MNVRTVTLAETGGRPGETLDAGFERRKTKTDSADESG